MENTIATIAVAIVTAAMSITEVTIHMLIIMDMFVKIV